MATLGYRLTVKSHLLQLARGTRRGRAFAVAAVGTAVLPATLLLSGCGQNFHQEGGVLPVPHASTEGLRTNTPAPALGVPSQPPVGPGYAPPRTSGPTQTVVPNRPGKV